MAVPLTRQRQRLLVAEGEDNSALCDESDVVLNNGQQVSGQNRITIAEGVESVIMQSDQSGTATRLRRKLTEQNSMVPVGESSQTTVGVERIRTEAHGESVLSEQINLESENQQHSLALSDNLVTDRTDMAAEEERVEQDEMSDTGFDVGATGGSSSINPVCSVDTGDVEIQALPELNRGSGQEDYPNNIEIDTQASAPVNRSTDIMDVLQNMAATFTKQSEDVKTQMEKYAVRLEDNLKLFDAKFAAHEAVVDRTITEKVSTALAQVTFKMNQHVESELAEIDRDVENIATRMDAAEHRLTITEENIDIKCKNRMDTIISGLSELRTNVRKKDEEVAREFETIIQEVSNCSKTTNTLEANVTQQNCITNDRIRQIEETVAPLEERLRNFRESIHQVEGETLKLQRTTEELVSRVTELERTGNTALENRIATMHPRSFSDAGSNVGPLVAVPESSPSATNQTAGGATYAERTPVTLNPAEDTPQRVDLSAHEPARGADITHCGRRTESVSQYIPKAVAKVKLEELPRFSCPEERHPVEFINRIEKYFRIRKCHLDAYLDEIVGALEGPAEKWIAVDVQHVETYAEFKHKFLERYWSEATQMSVRNDIIRGRYDCRIDGSMANHFRTQVAMLRFIDPPLSDRDITSIMINHYDDSIRRVLKLHSSWTVPTLAAYLDEIEPTSTDVSQRVNLPPTLNTPPKREDNPSCNSDNRQSGDNWRHQDRGDRMPERNNRQRQGLPRQQGDFRRGQVRNGVYHMTYNRRRRNNGNRQSQDVSNGGSQIQDGDCRESQQGGRQTMRPDERGPTSAGQEDQDDSDQDDLPAQEESRPENSNRS